jgi:uncharacterized repeat protein (TIGR01451 family)
MRANTMNVISSSLRPAGRRALHAAALVLALAASAWFGQPVHAQGLAQPTASKASPLASELVATRIALREDGREVQEPAQSVKPGDVVQYSVTFKNTSKAQLKQVAATLPIPRGTEFVISAVKPEGAMASIDGVRYEPMPLKRKVQQADGRWVDVAIPLSEYQSLRWPARTLGAGEQFSASARVRVTDNTSRVATASSAVK